MRVLSRPKIVAALVLAAAAGPLFAPVAAVAASTPSVSFSGGCGLIGLGSYSKPSAASVSIAAGSSVTFVNHLNTSAQLFINGSSQASLRPDYQVKVAFSASASVSLVPSCLLGSGGAGTVSVRVSSPTGSPAGPAPTTGAPTHASPTARASAISPSATARPSSSPSGVLAPSGTPSLDQPGLVGPSGPSAGAAGGVTAPSGGPMVASVGSATPATSGHQGPDRLLVVISAVCIIGVTIALIRAIVAQRAIRVATA
jgi:hypothetical protein